MALQDNQLDAPISEYASMSRPMPSLQGCKTGVIDIVKFSGVVELCAALKNFKTKSTDPEAGIFSELLAVSILSTGNWTKALVFSIEEVVDCA